MQKIIYTKSLVLPTITKLAEELPKNSVVCFHGEMGSGKTTLIKGIVQYLGALEEGNSPTFGIVNEYTLPNGKILGYHFDFYRLKSVEEALDLGLEEYLSQDVWVFIEWPEIVKTLLPEKRIDIYLKVLDPNTRQLSVETHDPIS